MPIHSCFFVLYLILLLPGICFHSSHLPLSPICFRLPFHTLRSCPIGPHLSVHTLRSLLSGPSLCFYFILCSRLPDHSSDFITLPFGLLALCFSFHPLRLHLLPPFWILHHDHKSTIIHPLIACNSNELSKMLNIIWSGLHMVQAVCDLLIKE